MRENKASHTESKTVPFILETHKSHNSSSILNGIPHLLLLLLLLLLFFFNKTRVLAHIYNKTSCWYTLRHPSSCPFCDNFFNSLCSEQGKRRKRKELKIASCILYHALREEETKKKKREQTKKSEKTLPN